MVARFGILQVVRFGVQLARYASGLSGLDGGHRYPDICQRGGVIFAWVGQKGTAGLLSGER